jgi:hypothetical protein
MKRIWMHGLKWVVAGACCLVTVAEVDAGIVFRRRGNRSGGVTYQATTTGTTTAAPTGTATTPGTAASAGPSGSVAAPTPTSTVTTATRVRRRGILGRRRGTVVTSSQMAASTGPGMTVRGQTPESSPTQPAPAPAR